MISENRKQEIENHIDRNLFRANLKLFNKIYRKIFIRTNFESQNLRTFQKLFQIII